VLPQLDKPSLVALLQAESRMQTRGKIIAADARSNVHIKNTSSPARSRYGFNTCPIYRPWARADMMEFGSRREFSGNMNNIAEEGGPMHACFSLAQQTALYKSRLFIGPRHHVA
jgi:hypothetical protein